MAGIVKAVHVVDPVAGPGVRVEDQLPGALPAERGVPEDAPVVDGAVVGAPEHGACPTSDTAGLCAERDSCRSTLHWGGGQPFKNIWAAIKILYLSMLPGRSCLRITL